MSRTNCPNFGKTLCRFCAGPKTGGFGLFFLCGKQPLPAACQPAAAKQKPPIYTVAKGAFAAAWALPRANKGQTMSARSSQLAKKQMAKVPGPQCEPMTGPTACVCSDLGATFSRIIPSKTSACSSQSAWQMTIWLS